MDDRPDDELTADELAERKRKEKEQKKKDAEDKVRDAEQKKADNAAYRAQRKIEREQEEKLALAEKRTKGEKKKAIAEKQKERDVRAKAMVSDKADDKRKRFDFLLNSAAGDLFRTFVEASSPTKKKFDGAARKVLGKDAEAAEGNVLCSVPASTSRGKLHFSQRKQNIVLSA